MKKTLLKITILFFIFCTKNVLFSQTIEEENHRIRSTDEYLREPILIDDGHSGNTPCYYYNNYNCTRDVRDFTFTTTSSFNQAIANHNAVIRAARMNHQIWFNKQTNIVKNHLESKYNKSFSNYNEAKNELFKNMSSNNVRINSVPVKNKYGGYKNNIVNKNKGYLKTMKFIKVRESEIRAGRINNSTYPNEVIGNKKMIDIKSLSELSTQSTNYRNAFVTNNKDYNKYKNIELKAGNLGNDFYSKKILPVRNNYYNSFNDWDKLDLMQYYINYDKYKEIQECYVCIQPVELRKFENIEVATPKMIEDYAVRNRGGDDMNIYHPDYWKRIFKQKFGHSIYWMSSDFVNQAKQEQQRLIDTAIKSLLDNTTINGSHDIDHIVGSLGSSDPNQITWLNSLSDNDIKQIKDDFVMANVQWGPDLDLSQIYKVKRDKQITRIINGGLVVAMANDLNLHPSTRNSLYKFENLANGIRNHLNNIKVNGQYPINSIGYIEGQLELENLMQNLPWQPSTGTIDGVNYTHFRVKGNTRYFKMVDGSIIATSGIEKKLGKTTFLEDKFIDTNDPGGQFRYIKFSSNEPWQILLPKSEDLAGDLTRMFGEGLLEGAKLIGSVALPVEDIKIIFTGKDFNNEVVSRWKGGGGLLLTVVPALKLVKGAKVMTVVTKVGDKINDWTKIITWGGKTYKLKYKIVDNIITFGDRGQLARILKTSSNIEAHHIIPWAKCKNAVIQAAARVGFHPNMVQNGLGLKKYTKLIGEGLHGNHPAYDKFVVKELEAFANSTPKFTPEQANRFIMNELIPDLKIYIIEAKNSGLNLNEYFKTLL